MPYFDFSLPKKKEKRKTSKNTLRSKILEKNVQGVVWIDDKGELTIKVIPDKRYKIHLDSYSCKGKKNIYARKLENRRVVCIIRNIGEYFECNHNIFLPFAVGSIVSGNIVQIGFNKQFIINKCWTDLNNDDAHLALEYYRDNYDTIINALENKTLNAT